MRRALGFMGAGPLARRVCSDASYPLGFLLQACLELLLRFCLSDLVIMKHVPARTCTAREFGLDLGKQTLNAKGAGLHGCWSSSAQGLFRRELPARLSPPGLPRVALALLPQRPRHNETRTGADVHCTRVRPRPWQADAQCEGRWASWVLVL